VTVDYAGVLQLLQLLTSCYILTRTAHGSPRVDSSWAAGWPSLQRSCRLAQLPSFSLLLPHPTAAASGGVIPPDVDARARIHNLQASGSWLGKGPAGTGRLQVAPLSALYRRLLGGAVHCPPFAAAHRHMPACLCCITGGAGLLRPHWIPRHAQGLVGRRRQGHPQGAQLLLGLCAGSSAASLLRAGGVLPACVVPRFNTPDI